MSNAIPKLPAEAIGFEKEPTASVEPKSFADEVFGNIHDSLREDRGYYQINKKQAASSFTISVVTICAGFATLILGIFLFYVKGPTVISLASLSAIAGVLLNFIGGASFYFYLESVKRLNAFHDKLVRIQDTMLAITLCDQLTKDCDRDRIKEILIIEIVKRTIVKADGDAQVESRHIQLQKTVDLSLASDGSVHGTERRPTTD